MAVIHLDRPFASTPLTRLWSLVLTTITSAPSSISIQTQLADGVLTITTLRIGIEVSPHLKVSTLTTESATSRGVVFPEVPAHRLNWHFIGARLRQTHVGTRNCFTKRGNDGLWRMLVPARPLLSRHMVSRSHWLLPRLREHLGHT